MASGEGQTMSIGEAASKLGVSVKTVRRWADTGKLKVERSPSGHGRFFTSEINQMVAQQPRPSLLLEERITINYARVSSHDQKEDLKRQIQVLEQFSGSHGWQYETIKDTGSGLNYQKKGLQKLLKRLMKGDVGRLVLTHKDRLLRFGAELVFAICEEFGRDIIREDQLEANPMATLTYVKGLPTKTDELNPLGFTEFEMFLTSYSRIFHQAACETVNHLLSGTDFDKKEWNTYLQTTYGINKRHANGVIHFAKGAYQSARSCRENQIKTLTFKLNSAEKWVKTKSKLLKDGNKFYRKKNWQKSKTGLKLPLCCWVKYRRTNWQSLRFQRDETLRKNKTPLLNRLS